MPVQTVRQVCVSSGYNVCCTYLSVKLLCSPWCQDTNPLVLPKKRWGDNVKYEKKNIDENATRE